MKLPYLISLASWTPGVERYLGSLRNLENSVEWVDVRFKSEPGEYNPIFQFVPGIGVRNCFVDGPYPGHLYRLDYIPDDLDPKRWWIFTDTADVVFQAPIPDLEELGKTIYVAPENEVHRNNGYWAGLISEYPKADPLLDRPIYNMGCWAMRGTKALELVDYLRMHRHDCGPAGDQPLYNLWLREQPADIVGVHSSLMVTLYANLEKGYCRRENGLFVNEQGEPFSIVHANGSTKEHL